MKITYKFGNQTLVSPSVNMLSSSAEIKGDIVINGDIRIDGSLTGNIICKGKITIGPTGFVDGQIDCKNIEISGRVRGTIIAEELVTLKENSHFVGDIKTGKLVVEEGAKLTMTCDTKMD